MKICVLATFPNPNLPHTFKGGYRRTTELLKVLSRSHEVRLLVATPSSPWKLSLPGGLPVDMVSSPALPVQWLKTLALLTDIFRTHDVLLAYNPTLRTLPALIARLTPCALVIDYVDIQGTEVYRRQLFRYLSGMVERLMLRGCRNYLAITTRLVERIRAFQPDANVLLLRGVFSEPALSDEAGVAVDRRCINVLYLGSMFSFSGVDLLIKAFGRVSDERLRLFIVGSGPEQPSLERLAREVDGRRICFVALTDPQLHGFLRQMDILTIPFVDHPRNRANFPSKVIEYLWSGKSILATRVGEVPQVLDHGDTAFLVPDGDIQALADGLSALAGDAELRARLGGNGRRLYETHFSPQAVEAQLNRFLQQILEV